MNDGRPVVGLRCLGCGYDLSGLGPGVCPECGLAVGPYEVAIARARAEAMARYRRRRGTAAVWWAGVIVVYGGAMGAFALDWRVGWHAVLTMALFVAGSLLVAWPALRLARRADRRVGFAVWAQTVWWLHTPWLVLGPVGLAAIVLALADSWVGVIGPALPIGMAIIGAVATGSLTLVCWLVHMDEMNRLSARLGLRLGAAAWALRVLSAVAALASGLIGLSGGLSVLAAMGGRFGWFGA